MRRSSVLLASLGAALLLVAQPSDGAPARAESRSAAPFSAEELIRAVARAQRRADLAVTASTFDQVEVRTDYGSDGKPKKIRRRRFEYFSGDEPGRPTRELVEVDGRPATEAEKRADAEEEATARRRRDEPAAAARAATRAGGGTDEDPLIGARRLSDLIDRFSYGPVEEVFVAGRPSYALEFSPRPGLHAATLGDRALNALAGRVVVDASDLQVVSVEARLVTPVKVGMGVAVNVKSAGISYRARQVAAGAWLPCVVELRVTGRTAVVFRLDSAFRFEFSGYARFSVDVESNVGQTPAASVQSAP
ncbi:MAG: hypothetical protein KJ062_12795 [Thermoanaerobaculia bacterium]|nr:hypothetical protein [Thermoanaerobaculia bacterium]